jgi:DNA-binding NtrC family response regulator
MHETDPDTFEDALVSSRPSALALRPHLFVVIESDRLNSGGARYPLNDIDEVIIGRGAERSARLHGPRRLWLTLPGRSMSSTHARLVRTQEGFTLEDCRSTNGSWVNGQRRDRALLEDGDLIEVGRTVLSVCRALPTPTTSNDAFDAAELSEADGMQSLEPLLAGVFCEVKRFAKSELSVLLLGETGTGKEVMARAIHNHSGRTGPFIAVNCGALAPNLIEAQLFGHVKGAFSGATRAESGFVRAADQGTLFLDEVGDLPSSAQTALLRVLQEREVVPVGGVQPVRVDVRVVAATNRPLAAMVSRETFRGDLLARLDGYSITLPRLAERRHDLGLLTRAILHLIPSEVELTLGPGAALALLTHSWPYNVRELASRLKRACVLAEGGVLTSTGLGFEQSTEPPRPTRPPSLAPLSPEDQRLRDDLTASLRAHRGNITEVARQMGKARMQVQRWIKRFSLDAAAFKSENH